MCTGVMEDALVDLLDQCWPVSKRDVELATKDKVKLHRIGPLGLNVVDFEPDIWRHESRLDRADVDPKHVDVGKGFGKVDGPCCSESCQSLLDSVIVTALRFCLGGFVSTASVWSLPCPGSVVETYRYQSQSQDPRLDAPLRYRLVPGRACCQLPWSRSRS